MWDFFYRSHGIRNYLSHVPWNAVGSAPHDSEVGQKIKEMKTGVGLLVSRLKGPTSHFAFKNAFDGRAKKLSMRLEEKQNQFYKAFKDMVDKSKLPASERLTQMYSISMDFATELDLMKAESCEGLEFEIWY